MPALKINLLPGDLAPKASVLKLANALKKLSLLGFALFLVGTLGGVAFFIYLTTEVESLRTDQEQSKKTISSLEQTEQRIILVKDRVQKAERIIKTAPTEKRLQALTALVTKFPNNVVFTSVEILPERLDLTLLAPDSSVLKETMSALADSDLFKKVDMISLGLNPKSGYLVSLQLF